MLSLKVEYIHAKMIHMKTALSYNYSIERAFAGDEISLTTPDEWWMVHYYIKQRC